MQIQNRRVVFPRNGYTGPRDVGNVYHQDRGGYIKPGGQAQHGTRGDDSIESRSLRTLRSQHQSGNLMIFLSQGSQIPYTGRAQRGTIFRGGWSRSGTTRMTRRPTLSTNQCASKGLFLNSYVELVIISGQGADIANRSRPSAPFMPVGVFRAKDGERGSSHPDSLSADDWRSTICMAGMSTSNPPKIRRDSLHSLLRTAQPVYKCRHDGLMQL